MTMRTILLAALLGAGAVLLCGCGERDGQRPLRRHRERVRLTAPLHPAFAPRS